jgi:hypothetical protein
MGVVTKPTTFVDGTVPTAAQFNNDFDTIYNEFNGNIEDANIKASAGIGISKLDTATVAGLTTTQTLTNKRITKRVGTTTSSATPSINTDSYDAYSITALAAAITSMSSGLSGTPTNFQTLIIRIKDNGTARAITWGASFEAKGVTLPTTTVLGKVLTVGLLYDTVTSKWGCVAALNEQ